MLHEREAPASAAGQRLDVWLETALAGCSRSLVSKCIRQGLCTVSSGKVKPGMRLRGGETIAIEVPELEPLSVEPEDLPLSVLHEEDDLIVINKAPGMVVHPAIGHPRGTLVNALLGRYQALGAGADTWRPGLIHRLDADTSGVIAIARTAAALAWYQDAFRERQVGKRYLALVHGLPKQALIECTGALGRHPKDFRKRAVLAADQPGAKAAHTSLVVRHRGDAHSVVEAILHTGRTHQIRVHATAAGHPILADRVYGRESAWPQPSHDQVINRQALHAWRLDLPRPDGSRLIIEAPIPDDLAPWVPANLSSLAAVE